MNIPKFLRTIDLPGLTTLLEDPRLLENPKLVRDPDLLEFPRDNDLFLLRTRDGRTPTIVKLYRPFTAKVDVSGFHLNGNDNYTPALLARLRNHMTDLMEYYDRRKVPTANALNLSRAIGCTNPSKEITDIEYTANFYMIRE